MIHKYQHGNIMLVLDVYSGAVHIVDSIVYDIIDSYKELSSEEIIFKLKDKYNKNEIAEAIKEIEILEKEGLLFTKDYYEDYTLDNRDTVIKALCIHIAHDCNIRCKYCFASQGDFQGARTLMSEEVGIKAIDFLLENSGNRKNLEIDFFGGEPLLNFEVVKKIVEYGRSKEKQNNKKFRFTLTTNGVMLNEQNIQYINKYIDNVVLSIDGRKKVNDNMRYTQNGDGTYDIIVPKIKKLIESRQEKNYYVRGTFTRDYLDFSQDVLHLADLGFKNTSIEPVVTDPQNLYSIREEDLPVIFDQYDILAEEYMSRYNENRFNFFHFQVDLNQGPCFAKRISGCGAGLEYLAITPEGDIFPCHQFVGQKEFLMGNLAESRFDKSIGISFSKAHVYNKSLCQQCWAKFYCSGGCHANAYHSNGDISQPYELGCKMEKKRIECSLGIQAKLFNGKDVK
ncbi:MAG: thioether cross-link-forming SCIFF peptide maturase [Alkaliphilus sp.]|nr:thioether cross-link-forming SCIFF peptide maturase [Alkaliphilus sp.]